MPRRFIYPENEIMFRIAHNNGVASFHDDECSLDPAIELLVKQGWIRRDGPSWPCGGRQYTRYKLTEMESVSSLKARL